MTLGALAVALVPEPWPDASIGLVEWTSAYAEISPAAWTSPVHVKVVESAAVFVAQKTACL